MLTDAFMIVQDDLHELLPHVGGHVEVRVLQDELAFLGRQCGRLGLELGPDGGEIPWVDLVQLAGRHVFDLGQQGPSVDVHGDGCAVVHRDLHEALPVRLDQVGPAGEEGVVRVHDVHHTQVATTRGTAPFSFHPQFHLLDAEGAHLDDAVDRGRAHGPIGLIAPPELPGSGPVVEVVGVDEVDPQDDGLVQVVDDDERVLHGSPMNLDR